MNFSHFSLFNKCFINFGINFSGYCLGKSNFTIPRVIIIGNLKLCAYDFTINSAAALVAAYGFFGFNNDFYDMFHP